MHKFFVDYPFSLEYWEEAKGWYSEPEQKQLKKFCTTAHKAAEFGEEIVDTVVLDMNRLTFVNEKYKARDIRTLTYGINGTLWYLAEGVREDCAFYLDLVNITTMEFQLQKQVCGVEELGVYVPPRIPDPMEYD